MGQVYPIFLDLSDRRVLIVGGGAVAARKADGAIAGGASSVRAVAPRFVKHFPAQVEMIAESYDAHHLEQANLVFAATDSAAVNAAVVADARQRNLLVQRVDAEDGEGGDFLVPAVLRTGPITLAVSAGAPALSAALRDLIAGCIGPEWMNLATAIRHIRPRLKSAAIPIQRRREILRELASSDASAALADGGEAGLWTWLRRRFADLPDLPPAQEQP